MPYQTIFFDLDDTLYGKETGVWQSTRKRIELYMQEHMGMPVEKVHATRDKYLAEYGSTLRGLYLNHHIDPEEYLVYVHDVPIEKMLSPNPKLAEMLSRLPQQKWIFTNASVAHARRVLEALGIGAHFEGIIDVKAMEYHSKPNAKAYEVALRQISPRGAAGALFVDDQGVNLSPAKGLGAGTVLIGSQPHPAADYFIKSVEDLISAVPALVE